MIAPGRILINAPTVPPFSTELSVTQVTAAPAQAYQLAFSPIPNVPANQPVAVQVRALDQAGNPITGMPPGEVRLAPIGYTGSISPNRVNLTNGTAVSQVTFTAPGTAVKLQATLGGVIGVSNAFEVTRSGNGTAPATVLVTGIDFRGVAQARVQVQMLSREFFESITDAQGVAHLNLPEGPAILGAITSAEVHSGTQRIDVRLGAANQFFISIRGQKAPVILVPGMMDSWDNAALAAPTLPKEFPAKRERLTIYQDSFSWHDIRGVPVPIPNTGWDHLKDELAADYAVFECPWDWRMTLNAPDPRNGATAWQQYLIPAIDEAKRITGYSQVRLVSHSMGGLLARSYLASNSYEQRHDVSHLVMIGTPHEGAAPAYRLWFGGDASASAAYSLAAENVFERSHTGFRAWERSSAIDKAYFFHTEIPSLKELLPIYPCLRAPEATEFEDPWSSIFPRVWSHVETSPLYSLRAAPLGIEAKRVRALLLASRALDETPTLITVTSNAGNTGYFDGKGNLVLLYPDGIPLATTARDMGPGDGTVALQSARGGQAGLANRPSVTWTTEDNFNVHTAEPGNTKTIGQVKSFLQTATQAARGVRGGNEGGTSAPEYNLRLSVVGNAFLLLTPPSDGAIGVNPDTNEAVNTVSIGEARGDAAYSAVSIVATSPGVYVARIKLEPNAEVEVSAFASLNGKSGGYHRLWIGAGGEGRLRITLPADASGNVQFVSDYDAVEPLLAQAAGTGVGTSLSWVNSGAASYKVFGRRDGDAFFTLVGNAAGPSFIAPQPWADGGSEVWQYAVVPLAADGTGGPASELVTNLSQRAARLLAPETTALAPATLTFRDTSLGQPTAWSWDFDADGVAESTEQNPTVTLADAGTYQVTLRITFADGKSLVSDDVQVFVAPTSGEVSIDLGSEIERPAGARWRLSGEAGWHSVTDVAMSVAYGTQTVQFEQQTGWTTPPDQTITIAPEDPFRVVRANYLRHGETYQEWAARLLGEAANDPTRGGPDADFDRDGIKNLVEYALGLDPRTADADIMTAHHSPGGELLVTFRRNLNATIVEIFPEGSDDLQEWHEVSPWSREETLIAPAISEVTLHFQFYDAGRQFYRLKITVP